MPDLTILRLSEQQLDQAYPLVRSSARIGPGQWQRFGRELIAGGGGGIVAAQAGENCLHGLAAFRSGGSLRHPHGLRVELLVAFELSRRAPVRRALCTALVELAMAQGCDSIVFTTAAPFDPASLQVPPGWAALGAKVETVDLVQRLHARDADFVPAF